MTNLTSEIVPSLNVDVLMIVYLSAVQYVLYQEIIMGNRLFESSVFLGHD